MGAVQQDEQLGQIVAKASQDESFKKRLLADPSAILKEHGLKLPAGVQIRVVENTDQVVHLTLPAKPREEELSDDDLENVAGGAKRQTGLSPSARAKARQPGEDTGKILVDIIRGAGSTPSEAAKNPPPA